MESYNFSSSHQINVSIVYKANPQNLKNVSTVFSFIHFWHLTGIKISLSYNQLSPNDQKVLNYTTKQRTKIIIYRQYQNITIFRVQKLD